MPAFFEGLALISPHFKLCSSLLYLANRAERERMKEEEKEKTGKQRERERDRQKVKRPKIQDCEWLFVLQTDCLLKEKLRLIGLFYSSLPFSLFLAPGNQIC